MKVFHSREEDTARIDFILKSLTEEKGRVFQICDYALSFDPSFNCFEAVSLTDSNRNNVFKDGREAIDFCLYNDQNLAEEQDFYNATSSEVNHNSQRENSEKEN